MSDIYQQWADSCQGAGIPLMSLLTCARLLALYYVHGGNSESFTHSRKAMTDVRHAAKRFNLGGGGVPRHVELLKQCVVECWEEDCQWKHELAKKYSLTLLQDNR